MSLVQHIVARGGLRLRYQPIFHLLPGERMQLHAVECLSRGPRGTALEEAQDLFNAARQRRESAALDRLVVATALDELGSVAAGLRVAFNVDVQTLEDDADFPLYFLDLLSAHGVTPRRVTVEVVEQSGIRHPARVSRGVHLLRRAGVGIALDDVGEGFANHRTLLVVRPDVLKLDRYIVRGVASDIHRRAIAASMLQLARGFGGRLVAEGVESLTQLGTLRDLGIELFQGFLLARPCKAKEIQRRARREPQTSSEAGRRFVLYPESGPNIRFSESL